VDSDPLLPIQESSGIPPESPTPLPSPPAEVKPKVEDPPFRGWDVLVIVGVAIAGEFILGTLVLLGAHFLFYKSTPLVKLGQVPEVVLFNMVLLYIVVFAAMYQLGRYQTGKFWQAVRWNWPQNWMPFLAGGVILYIALAGLGQILPLPKHLPIDRFFGTTREAWIMSAFAVSLAPLMEELFFRGFLYPVLARRIGMVASVVIVGAFFGLVHGAQLSFSWAVLIIFLVGVALTAVRAVTKSTAASFLVHVGYNATISILLFVSTGGFRHMEKLRQ
jgi:membrane protease YdiL (CAAX protease family)